VQAHPRDYSSDLDVRDPRLRMCADVHHEPIDPTHVAMLAVYDFPVQDIAHQVHVSLR
jgi:hypothetical protein